MAEAARIACPACGYDLSAAGATGSCPECGHRFDAGALGSRERAEVSLALSLVAAGALGGVLASSMGSAFRYLPRANEGSAGDGEAAARLLAILPWVCLAYGLMLLGALTGVTALARRWPGVVALVFVVCGVMQMMNAWGSPDYSRWLQPRIYAQIASWVEPLAQGLTLVAAGVALTRIGVRLGAGRMRRWFVFLVVCGAVTGILQLAAMAQGEYSDYIARNHQGPNPFATPKGRGTPPPAPPPLLFVQTWSFTTSLNFLAGVAWWLAWPVLALVSIHLRALWRATASEK